MEMDVPNEWIELARCLISRKGTNLLLGSTDTGKSTLSRYLAETLLQSGLTVALVDADVGQCALGLPGTVSFAAFSSVENVKAFRCTSFSFIGSISPVPAQSFLIKETRRFVARGRTTSQVTLIDTTGLVDDELGRALKVAKIKAVRPDRIIAVERGGELEHVIQNVGDIDVVRLKPAPMARTRRRQSRIRYREAKLAAYFRGAGEILLSNHALEFFFYGRSISHDDVRLRPGAVVGLNKYLDSDGLGIVTEKDHDSMTLRTPLRSLKGIRRIMLGSITMDNFSPE
jgi:polynucleotide 5'-hydroxyl-kinase GRC3/NOL9